MYDVTIDDILKQSRYKRYLSHFPSYFVINDTCGTCFNFDYFTFIKATPEMADIAIDDISLENKPCGKY